jgi:hypothetical protein
MRINTRLGERNIYWNDANGHVCEILTISYVCPESSTVAEFGILAEVVKEMKKADKARVLCLRSRNGKTPPILRSGRRSIRSTEPLREAEGSAGSGPGPETGCWGTSESSRRRSAEEVLRE